MRNNPVHLNSLFENATEGIVATNNQGIIILINPSACQMFGYSPEELEGQKIEVLIPKNAKNIHVKHREDFYQDPKNRTMGQNRDLLAGRKDGSTFPVEVSLSTYIQNNERYVIAFIIDITRRKETEHNMILQQQQLEKVTDQMRLLNADLEMKVEQRTTILKEALQRLEQSQNELSLALDKEKQLNEIKGRFVSMASHEFRTPLSTVLSSASLIDKYTTSDDHEKRSRHIEKIKNSVKHLNTLLEDFLSLGKLEEGKIGIHLHEFNLEELIQDTIEEMNPTLKTGQFITYNNFCKTLITSDKNLIRNILFNLFSNAIKFSDISAPIHVVSQIKDSVICVSIQDEGMGISEEDKEHLFSSFFRGRNVTNIQGTGLGLHIVKKYVDLLGGSITMESTLDRGTKITFSIPDKG
ncbi:MAG TPA: PAS domain-containing sensor histidine kinase [Puia sp.]|nr:PAS domain-containing sensor histidine kinase [Puia sp.]